MDQVLGNPAHIHSVAKDLVSSVLCVVIVERYFPASHTWTFTAGRFICMYVQCVKKDS